MGLGKRSSDIVWFVEVSTNLLSGSIAGDIGSNRFPVSALEHGTIIRHTMNNTSIVHLLEPISVQGDSQVMTLFVGETQNCLESYCIHGTNHNISLELDIA